MTLLHSLAGACLLAAAGTTPLAAPTAQSDREDGE